MKIPLFDTASRVLIYGYGVEGQRSAAFLQQYFSDIEVSVFDDHQEAYKTKPELTIFDVIIVSPGVDRQSIQNVDPARLTSQTELFFSALDEEHRQRVIGIGGTKGKSTTTKFVAEMLQRSGESVGIGGNYGVPLLDLLEDFLAGRFRFIVAELSSFQLEHLRVSPGKALFLNFFTDHLDRHGDMSRYFAAKQHLWAHQKPGDILIIPESASFPSAAAFPEGIHFAPALPEDWFDPLSALSAEHFRENFGTALVLAELLGIDRSCVRETARDFESLPHRTEFIADKRDIAFYNDSIATTVESTMAAVQFFGERLGSLILGGVNYELDYPSLAKFLMASVPECFIIILESKVRQELVEALDAAGYGVGQYAVATDMKQAVSLALKYTSSGKVCLLSPAAKSYDRYKNYKQRGDDFRACVENI